MSGGLDSTTYDLGNAVRGLFWTGLAGVKPGDDGFDGARYCIGAPLARIELQPVFSQLGPRFPRMRLAGPAAQLTFNRDTLAGGLARLPVTW